MAAWWARQAARDTRSPAHARGRVLLVPERCCVNTGCVRQRVGNREWRLRPGIPSHLA